MFEAMQMQHRYDAAAIALLLSHQRDGVRRHEIDFSSAMQKGIVKCCFPTYKRPASNSTPKVRLALISPEVRRERLER